MQPPNSQLGKFNFVLSHEGKHMLTMRGQKIGMKEESGNISSTPFCPGVYLHRGRMHTLRDQAYHFEVENPQFHISFCLTGKSRIEFTDGGIRTGTILHSPSTCTVSYLNNAAGFWRPAGDSYTLAKLNLDPHAFPHVWRSFGSALPKELRPLAEGGDPTPFFIGLPVSPAIQMLLGAILRNPISGPGAQLMRECKTMELLIQIVSLLSKDCSSRLRDIPLSSKDIERIHAACNLLETELESPPTLSDLAHRVGLNEFKLKRGFRQVFDTTPFGRLRKVRMERARRYLESGEMNVYEACVAVGYSSLSNFIVLFKKEFGVTPGKILQCALRSPTALQKNIGDALPERF